MLIKSKNINKNTKYNRKQTKYQQPCKIYKTNEVLTKMQNNLQNQQNINNSAEYIRKQMIRNKNAKYNIKLIKYKQFRGTPAILPPAENSDPAPHKSPPTNYIFPTNSTILEYHVAASINVECKLFAEVYNPPNSRHGATNMRMPDRGQRQSFISNLPPPLRY